MEAELSAFAYKIRLREREKARIRFGNLEKVKFLESLLDISGRLRR
jgi:hypothetical protein